MNSIHIEDWGPGWTSLIAVVIYGAFMIWRSVRQGRAQKSLTYRVLVTGSRGKSGCVRLIHAFFSAAGVSSYGKVTGKIAVEINTDSKVSGTVRIGVGGIPEMRQALIRASEQNAKLGVFESMAVLPKLIGLTAKIIDPQIVVVPTIRLDHLEDEGMSEAEIARNIVSAIGKPEHLVTGVSHPLIQQEISKICRKQGIQLHLVAMDEDIPPIVGHHPLNVAIALKVCQLAGIDAKDALSKPELISREPEVATIRSIVGKQGTRVNYIDLGGANDPESAREGYLRLGLDRSKTLVVPVLINRWERPLRTALFTSLASQGFAVVGLCGSEARWSAKQISKASHGHTQIVRITPRIARDIDAIENLTKPYLRDGQSDITLVVLENTHDKTTETMREYFQEHGDAHEVGDWKAHR